MEVEIKIRLLSRESYLKVAALFKEHIGDFHQTNHFFDTTDDDLRKEKIALRFRFTNGKCVATVKEKSALQDGIQRSLETEEELDVCVAQDVIKSPSRIKELGTTVNVLRNIVSRYSEKDFKVVTSFRNYRRTYLFHGHTLELDETEYPFGKAWEIEIESANPESIREEIETLLQRNDIQYQHSTHSKYHNALRGQID